MCHERRTRGVVQVLVFGMGEMVGVRDALVEVWDVGEEEEGVRVDNSVVGVGVLEVESGLELGTTSFGVMEVSFCVVEDVLEAIGRVIVAMVVREPLLIVGAPLEVEGGQSVMVSNVVGFEMNLEVLLVVAEESMIVSIVVGSVALECVVQVVEEEGESVNH